VDIFVRELIEGKLITNWKNWENKYVDFVSSECSFRQMDFIFSLT